MRQCENIFVFIDLTKSIGSDLGGSAPPPPPPPPAPPQTPPMLGKCLLSLYEKKTVSKP